MSTARRPIQCGEVFERLEVIGPADPRMRKDGKGKIYRVSCRCFCGEETIVDEDKLRSGNTKSCGCLSREIGSRWEGMHGHRSRAQYSRTYNSWSGMKQRCTNPKTKEFRYYGARGITVCERWMNSFENFLADMGDAPPGLSLDRIESNGNYEPGNCRWADWDTQERNRRSNRRVVIGGINLTVAEASRALGISGATIGNRAKRLDISYQEAADFFINAASDSH